MNEYSVFVCCHGTEFTAVASVDGSFINSTTPQVIYTLHLRRKALYYVVNIIVPCCLLSSVAVSTFLLQPNCVDRLGLSTFVLFIYAYVCWK